MARKYSIQQARQKIRRVFQYLSELNRLKTSPILDLKEYDWIYRLDELPNHPVISRGAYFKMLEDFSGNNAVKNTDGDFIIKVGRPKESKCPEPSVILKNWLKPGFDKVGAEPDSFLKSSLKLKGTAKEKFDDVSDRVASFEDWYSEKCQWETIEKESIDTLAAFDSLFDLHGKIQRESEKYQIFAADGVLVMEHEGVKIEHPIFLQRVALEFVSSAPEFILRYTQDPPEVHSWILRYLGVDGNALKEVKQNLVNDHCHPLGGEETSEFLKNMVQKLWKEGKYYNSEIEAREASGIYVYRKPHIFLGQRTFGFSESIDTFLETIEDREDFPEALLRVVGINAGDGLERDDEELAKVDILLTKHANEEQERVIHRLEETGAVLVQGPPGTGKSHTIANLIGHLLAQKKSILVTSHTSKALRVVREHLAKPLQPLCVSVLQDDEVNNRQLEESITGIVNYLSKTSEKKLGKAIEKLGIKRDALKEEYENAKEELISNAGKEYQVLELGTQSKIPSEAARWLSENELSNGWISGPIEPGTEYPLSVEETNSLYELNKKISKEDEDILSSKLPDEQQLPKPEDFAEHFDALGKYKSIDMKLGTEFWSSDDQDKATLESLIEEATESAEIFGETEPWVQEFLEIGKRPVEERKPWVDIVELVHDCNEEIPAKEILVLDQGPKIESNETDRQNLVVCLDILENLEKNREKLPSLKKLLKPKWKNFIQSARVDSGQPSTKKHFKALKSYLEIKIARDSLVRRWTRLAEHLNEVPVDIDGLGKTPEKKLKPVVRQIEKAINLLDNSWGNLQQTLIECGFKWELFLKQGAPTSDVNFAMKSALETVLIPVLKTRIDFCEWQEVQKKQRDWVEYLDSFSRKESSYVLIKQLRSGLQRANYDTYRQAWERLLLLHDLKEGHESRLEILEKLKIAAPSWADEISKREKPHNSGEVPGNPEDAWTHRLWDQLLTEQAKTDLDQIQTKLNNTKEKIQESTAEYVEKLSWLAQLKRTGLEQQQALNGWLAIHKKIGKGTGRRVQELKQTSKVTLKKCRDAVPVWIMPISRVMESFDISNSGFDVVIIDEASQSDVLGLAIFAMAKEVVVVGDHEQVSPYGVGFQTDKIHELIDEILIDIPNKKLYDAKTSVYDLARQSFGGTIRLVEHFRCVPDIIQFSNHLCYGNEVKSLRESSSSQTRPALVAHYVKGATEVNKINQEEALEIVALIIALTKFKEYEKSTIGVISMVGTEQAIYIDSLLRRRLSVAEYERRRILCGNAAQFQGDERDVIFISMVNTPSESGKPLHLRVREDAKRVFNVAASRARDQLWVVHSLETSRDLKPNDLRLRLISHAENPDGLNPKPIDQNLRKLNSALEIQVHEKLEESKYSTLIGTQVGEFVIDLAVIGKKGNRVAIQCDGDREVSRELLEKSLYRQLTLERLGWRFIRVRGSEYLRHPIDTFKKIQKGLKKYDIEPLGIFSKEETSKSEKDKAKELLAEVKKRAQMSRSRWKEAPSIEEVQNEVKKK